MNNVFCINTGKVILDPKPNSLVKGYQSPTKDFDFNIIVQRIAARFGDCQSKGGVINTKSYKVLKNKVYIDSYGRGNIHNSKWQWRPKTSAEKSNWNRPMPFPSNPFDIEPLFKEHRSKEFVLGWRSDAFMWTDQRYGITKEVLLLVNYHGVNLTIETMSDLVAHDDYLQYIAGCTVVMNMGSGDENTERNDSPGAASIARRETAVAKLREHGIKVQYRVKGKLVDIFNPIRKVKEA
jgi:hypothetical protein